MIVVLVVLAAAVAVVVWALAGSGSETAAAPATPVDVTLTEFHVAIGQTTLAPGEYSFHITNGGTMEHEMLVFQSDLAPSAYPVDGADIPLMALIQECPAADVRMGMRVEAVWVPEAERSPSMDTIRYFRPTGEADAPIDDVLKKMRDA